MGQPAPDPMANQRLAQQRSLGEEEDEEEMLAQQQMGMPGPGQFMSGLMDPYNLYAAPML